MKEKNFLVEFEKSFSTWVPQITTNYQDTFVKVCQRKT